MQMLGPANNGVAFTNVDTNKQNEDGVALATAGKKAPPRSKAHITCHRCGVKGHYSTECKADIEEENETSEAMLLTGVENGEFDKANDRTVLSSSSTITKASSSVPTKIDVSLNPGYFSITSQQWACLPQCKFTYEHPKEQQEYGYSLQCWRHQYQLGW